MSLSCLYQFIPTFPSIEEPLYILLLNRIEDVLDKIIDCSLALLGF
jgi:hypothetical protein